MSYADGNRISANRMKAKAPPPFSLRLSEGEKARLRAEAGNQPLGAYIRSRLLGEDASKRRAARRPRLEEKTAARLLAELGRSQLAASLNQLARASKSGSLPITEETEAALVKACTDIRRMRDELMQAMGLGPTGGS